MQKKAVNDFNDEYRLNGSAAVREKINAVATTQLRALNISEFLEMEIPPRENILAPIMQTQSLAMLYAQRGIGKTHVALGIAHAVASGGRFLSWQAPRPRPVLYLDGEMSARAMQERLEAITQKSETRPKPDFFQIITPDMQETGMPDISTPEGQALLEPYVKDAELIIVDNISTLARTGRENEAESWLPVQGWILDMRRRGKSVLLVHHAGKGGQQRGTSRREDILDLVISLQRPQDYKSTEGARFETRFEKARHLTGDDAKPFEAMLMPSGGWEIKSLEDADLKRVLTLDTEGLSCREIAAETGISKSRINRMLKEPRDT